MDNANQFVGGLAIDTEGSGLFDFKQPADAELSKLNRQFGRPHLGAVCH
jgi:hypothetical protein